MNGVNSHLYGVPRLWHEPVIFHIRDPDTDILHGQVQPLVYFDRQPTSEL